MADHKLQNWAGNLTYSAVSFFQPSEIEEIQEIVARTPKIRALGTRHSFNHLADSPHVLLSTTKLRGIEEINEEAGTVTIQSGVTYGQLAPFLEEAGFALHNLASLPHISVVGACASATHGSGVLNQNLASQVRSLETVDPDGQIQSFSRESHPETFDGAVVSLGGMGVIVRMTLNLVPTFQMTQNVYEGLPFTHLQSDFDSIVSGGYSVSLFYDWRGDVINQVWIKGKVSGSEVADLPDEYFGAGKATRKLHPLPDISPENCTDQLGIPGPWHERLPHFKMEFTPSSGEELQSEFFVDRKDAMSALKELSSLREEIAPNLFVTEIRTVAADSFWASPNYQRESVGIHFTWRQNQEAVMALLPKIEERLAGFKARPHWGKLFTMSGTHLEALYPKMGDFRELLMGFDPERKFENPFHNRNIFGN